jgi:endonuclease/exonuclease/phosphatase family metal-dependent hydrolase
MYRKERYEMMSEGAYWLSSTPMMAGTTLEGQRLGRHVTWVRLREKKTGKEFRILDTHWPLEQDERIASAKMIAPETTQYDPKFPQVICGDFNSEYGSPELQIMLDAGWADSYRATVPSKDQMTGRKIDFILTHGSAKAVAAGMILDTLDGVRPSDHPFVWADVRI